MPTKVITITDELVTGQHLNQVYSHGFEYAVINDKDQMITPFVTCKDYFNDMVWALVHNKSAGIYGFKLDPSKAGFYADLNKLRIVIRDKSKKFEDVLNGISNSVELLNETFKELKFLPKLKVTCTANYSDGQCVVVNFPKKFMIIPPVMSSLFLFLRSGQKFDSSHTEFGTARSYIENMSKISGSSYTSSDKSDMKHTLTMIDMIKEKKLSSLFSLELNVNYNPKHSIGTIHNYYGIRSYVQMYMNKGLFNEAISN